VPFEGCLFLISDLLIVESVLYMQEKGYYFAIKIAGAFLSVFIYIKLHHLHPVTNFIQEKSVNHLRLTL